MLQVKNLSYTYTPEKNIVFPDFECKQGEQCLLLGQSGSGKTTLLHLIAGILTAQNGSILIDNQDITKISGRNLDFFRGANIGVVFQQHHFVSALHVEDNLLLAQSIINQKTSKEKVSHLLEKLNLADKRYQKPYTLSQGEQQRVAIARALMNNPKLILADEPTSALDDANSDEVIQLLEQQANDFGATLLIVTHDQRLKTRFSKQILL
jgi:ABC-type lipoprotein export system ATPase subunit